MKNQLRKATLRAAALTMSATIAATSVPMTAFAQDKPLPDEPEKAPEESTEKSDEEKVVVSEKTTSAAVNTADEKVDAIKPADNIATEEMKKDVTAAQAATDNAIKAEDKVATDAKNIFDAKTDIDTKEGEVNGIIKDAGSIVSKENENQESLYSEIDSLKTDIENATYKQDAQNAYDTALEKAQKADENYAAAEKELEAKKTAYATAKKDLEDKLSAYNTAIAAGVTDLGTVEAEIKNAQEKVDALQGQVQSAAKNLARTAAESLADEYNKANKTEDEKKTLFKSIAEEYYIKSIDSNAKDIAVGDYDSEYGVYPVTYLNAEGAKVTVYLSYTDNKGNNGITIEQKEIKKVVDKPEVAEHYTYGENNSLTTTDYNRLAADEVIIKQDGKDYLINGLDYDVKVKVGQDNVTKIENQKTEVTANGIVQVTGDVTTVTKTANALDVKSNSTYADRTSAESAANALKDQYESNGYEDVQVELITNDAKLQYTATAVFVDKLSFSDTIEDSNDHEYRTGEFLTEKNKEPIFFWQDRDKYVLGTSYVSNTRTYNDKVWDFWPIYYHYETKTEEISKTWTVDYAEVSKETVDYNPLDAIGDFIKNFTGKEKKSISVQEAVDKKLIANGGYVVGFEPVDGNLTKATVYCVKGTKVEATGDSAEAAQKALAELLKSKQMSGERYDTTSSVIVPESYSYKITGTKVDTKTENKLIKESTSAAAELTYVAKQEKTYKYEVNTTGKYNNSFLTIASDDEKARKAKETSINNLNDQLTEASKALTEAETKAASLKKQVEALKADATVVSGEIAKLDRTMTNIALTDFSARKKAVDEIKDAFGKLPNRPSNNGGSNNGGGSSNNNNNNQPAAPVLPVGPAATTTTTTQQVVTLVDDQTPLSATADDTVAPKTNKKAAKKNAAKTTDSDSKKTNKKAAKKQPKKVTPEVEDDTIDEDLEIVSLDDNDQVPLAPGVASNDSTKDIMDETASVSWLWLIILAVASVVTFGTYKGVKKHNENKGKNNR